MVTSSMDTRDASRVGPPLISRMGPACGPPVYTGTMVPLPSSASMRVISAALVLSRVNTAAPVLTVWVVPLVVMRAALLSAGAVTEP